LTWDGLFSQLVVGLFLGYWFSQLYLHVRAYARRHRVRQALARLFSLEGGDQC